MTLPVEHRDFTRSRLHEDELAADPFVQFQKWVDDAVAAHIFDWETITVATATSDGAPSARTLFLRGADQRGFVFYTNYESRKGMQLAENPRAAMVIHWRELERQISIEGTVEKISAAESDAYFATRPEQSQLGAWSSRQSQPLDSAETLSQRVEENRQRFAGSPIPRPPHWGGYRVVPSRIEFWQGGPGRLHDRFVYLRQGDTWTWSRLNP
ncbi:MAG: pyridoxamine 5'-phosphate oxidase [Planctomycetaceae bacterium]